MQYWDEMNTKWGFDEGATLPPDAEERRRVYVQVVNTLAAKLNSNIRVVVYDRGGCHNYCLVLFVSKDEYDAASKPDILSGNWRWGGASEPSPDEGMKKAIKKAHELELDDLVSTKVTINQCGLDEVLATI